MTPGKNNTTFDLIIDAEWLQKGDILTTPENTTVEITKVYVFTWWRKILFYLGFPYKHGVKVKQL